MAGANSHALRQVREGTYHTLTDAPRTLRPLSCSQLEALYTSVQELRNVEVSTQQIARTRRSGLGTRERDSGRLANSRHFCPLPSMDETALSGRALWQAVEGLCIEGYSCDFPWFKRDGQRLLCVADMVDAYDFIPWQ